MGETTNLKNVLLISVFLVATTCSITAARTIYVDDDANGLNDGSSWTDAYIDLQEALADANSSAKPVEIRVAQGIYEPAPPPSPGDGPNGPGSGMVDWSNSQDSEIQPGDRTATFQLISGVVIKGGYAGFDEPDPNTRDIRKYETILSGDLYGYFYPDYFDYDENSYHVVTGSNTDATAVLDGFTITSGNADGNDHDSYGGGMYNYGGSPTINMCIFMYNRADSEGGGMYNEQSSPTLTNCTFIDNSSDHGGGMSNFNNSEPVVMNCTFIGNSAERGGVMYNTYSSLTLTNCTFAENSALQGNALACNSSLHLYPSNLQITNCILWDGGDEIWNNDDSTITTAYTDVQGGWPGLGNIDADPCFVQLGFLGTYPLPIVWIQGDYRLRPGSACIDTGDPYYIAEPDETDLSGRPRVVAGRIDMGAYEFQIPRILYVDDDANGANDGSTWANAYNDLQDALYFTGPGDEIWVAQGTYKPGPPTEPFPSFPGHPSTWPTLSSEVQTATFQLKNAVVIKGGYAGFGQPDQNARDIYTYYTVLSGDLAGNDEQVQDPCDLLNDPCRADNTFSVVTGSYTDGSAVLDGFIITGGGGYDSWWYIHPGGLGNYGGGICIEEGSPTVTNCTFRENRAGYGGGMYNFGDSSPKVTNCTFSRNAADEVGGGVYYSRGYADGDWIASPIFTNCIFTENVADYGGGMCIETSEPTITNCRFNWNRAYWRGGGIANGSDAILTNCKFTANLVGFRVPWLIPFIPLGGGAMYNEGSDPTISNCTFSGNWSGSLSGNWNGNWFYLSRGAIFNSNSCPTITNCTFTGNEGRAIACDSWNHLSPSNVQLTNCILWNPGSEILNKDESVITITYSNVQGGWPGQGNIDTDPCFAQPGQFSFSTGVDGYYNLLSDSLCIDAGDPNYVPGSNETDFDGKDRVVGGRIDMGAYEFQGLRDQCVFYVDDDAAGANNGSSWVDAFNFLQDALTEAQYGDTILVAQGMYKPDRQSGLSRGNCLDTFRLKSGVAIVGGHGGFAEQDPNFRNIDSYKTILSGDIGQLGFKGDNSYHVVASCYTDATAVLDGCTITAGNADRQIPWLEFWLSGGGMYNEYARPTLLNCTFTANSAGLGGGLCNRSSRPAITNCTFNGNSAGAGGGMYNRSAKPILTDCTFIGNSTDWSGGGMYNYHSDPIVTNCILSGNTAGSYGGGVSSVSYSSVMLTNCTFSGNMALKNGGGMYSERHSSNLLTNCLFSGNVATLNGGALYNLESSPVLNNCTISSNWAGSYGGGVYNEGSDANMTNCILWDDSAAQGSEIYLGRYIDYMGREYPSTMDVNYSDVGGWDTNIYLDDDCMLNWGSGNIDADPCFVQPGYWDPNGTSDDPNDDYWIYGDYHLLPGSPCIDAGDPDYIAEPNETDLDGKPRIIYGRIDMGAYEFQNAPPVVNAGPDQIVECACNTEEGTNVTLDGTGSYDADGDPLTYTWTGPFVQSPVQGAAPTVTLEGGCLGEYVFTLVVNDGIENSEPNDVVITVVDTTPPEFEFSVTPTVLWPPNHKMVEITPSWTVSDECDALPDVSLISITMNEGNDTVGDGHTTNDIQISDDGSVYLRSERSGTSGDRVYTITYQAVDDCGNTTVRSATVSIPHDFKVLARIAAQWLWAGPGKIPEDLNGDGVVNLKDIAIFANNWIQ
ncbi:MAG: choice-of-anchor Q domain-containing protein [Planctomycetota bacterium]